LQNSQCQAANGGQKPAVFVDRVATLEHDPIRLLNRGFLKKDCAPWVLPFARIANFSEAISNMNALRLLVLAALLFTTGPALAAQCGGDFQTFVANISREAQAQGISRSVIDSALGGVTQDGAVLAFDRRQRGTFNKSFEQYVATRVGPGRIRTGKAMLQRHAALLSRIEQQFGVPPQVLVAIWGLETDFGSGDMGKLPVFRVLATMAHDCRRTDLFQRELLAALQIVQRGDLGLRDMIGAYAGEIGQTQFLPSSYIKYGVDYDGNGHVDLRHSVPDVLASTANLLKTNGWRAGGSYEEGSANFDAMREWNRAVIYRKTIAYFANRLLQ
jgi:lytic murein transglycosylase